MSLIAKQVQQNLVNNLTLAQLVCQQNTMMQALSQLDQYCWCDLNQEAKAKESDTIIRIDTLSTSIEDDEPTPKKQPKAKKALPRRKKNNLPKVDKKLKRILAKISQGKFAELLPSEKSSKGSNRNRSGRRSKFIGVSKNNQHWQVLINISNVKKYIGTFPTQKEAAVAYDFYAIALHGDRATTNFGYSPELVAEMAESFFKSAEVEDQVGTKMAPNQRPAKSFDPSLFVERV